MHHTDVIYIILVGALLTVAFVCGLGVADRVAANHKARCIFECPPEWQCNGSAETNNPRCCP